MSGALGQVAILMTLMRQLEGVMQAEGGILREMRLDRLGPLESEKAALAERYEVELRRLRTSPESIASLDDAARSELEFAMRRFQTAAQANAQRLTAALEVVEGVVKALGSSLATNRLAAGYRAGPGRAAGSSLVSLSLNRHV